MTHTTVKAWRDDVSETLGYMRAKQEEMHKDIKKTNGKVIEHEERIDALETTESNRKAVKRYLNGVWAVIGGITFWVLEKIFPAIVRAFS